MFCTQTNVFAAPVGGFVGVGGTAVAVGAGGGVVGWAAGTCVGGGGAVVGGGGAVVGCGAGVGDEHAASSTKANTVNNRNKRRDFNIFSSLRRNRIEDGLTPDIIV